MPMSTPATPKTPDPPADPEAQRVESLDARFGKIETEQAEQRGLLQQILGKVGGGLDPTKAPGSSATGASPGTGSPDMAAMMRKAVEDVGAENARKKAEEEHAAEHAALRASKPVAETQPRERQGGIKSKLQRAMFGGD
jgi:hypothetical protein